MATIFVIDDEPSICWGLTEWCRSMGHRAESFSSVEKALADPTEPVDIVISDVRLPGMSGLEGIQHFQERWPNSAVIVITAHGNLSTAIDSIKLGAFDYLVKPFEIDQLQVVIDRALSIPIQTENDATQTGFDELLVGSSALMNSVFKKIALAAHSEAPILLEGESGTGKELAARAIHSNGARAQGRFVAVNLAALNPMLAESELFGHVKGAFTGASSAKPGLLQQADQGTLFLDEVAEIPESIQVKLLRALEQKEFQAVGSTETVHADFRIISATHRDLANLADEGRFRHDLFFRLSSFVIHLPPLRDRDDDRIELAEYFLNQFSQGATSASLSPEARREIEMRPWYGNVRELRNAMERASIVSRGRTIFPEDLPSPNRSQVELEELNLPGQLEMLIEQWTEQKLRENAHPDNLHEILVAEIEKPLMRLILKKNRGQFSAAARQLGLHRTTLKKKAESHGLLDE